MLITFSYELAKSHIDACLNVGNEKLELAMSLRNGKKYSVAIPLYIGAYEEIGQALFLENKVSGNEQVTENDWNKYVKPRQHDKKILSHHIIKKEQLTKSTNEEFEILQKSNIGKIFSNPNTREDNLETIETVISLYSKLHKLRQTFDYSHDLDGRIMKRDYDEQDLESLCYLLENECLSSYYLVKMGLEYHDIALPTDTVEIALSKSASLPSVKKLTEIYQNIKSKSGRKLGERGFEFIESF